MEALGCGVLDAGFAISPLPRKDVRLDVLCRAGFVLQAPSSLPTKARHRHLSDYRDQPFVALAASVTPGYAARCQHLFEEAGFTPKIVQYADNRQTIMTGLCGCRVSVAPALILGSQRVGVKNTASLTG